MTGTNANTNRWAEAETLAGTLARLLECGHPLVSEGGPLPEAAAAEGKVVLILDAKADLADSIDTLRCLASQSAVTLLAVPLPDLEEGSGPGFAEVSDQLSSAGLPIAWEGLTFSQPERFERQAGLFVLSDRNHDQLSKLMETGVANLALHAGHLAPAERPARVCIATNEVFGPTKNGGIGTACTSLAHALADAGDEVTVLFLGDKRDLDRRGVDLAEWEKHYEKHGIRFVAIVPLHHPTYDWEHANVRTSHAAYLWLSEQHDERPFDVIHFAECNGHGYFTALSSRLGLQFRDAAVCLTTHSSTEWIFESNHVPFDSYYNLSTDWIERRSVEDCDVLIGPSLYLHQYMRSRDWTLPDTVHQQQYVQPHAARAKAGLPLDPKPVDELVFFGRLETRKGLVNFCDALDEMASHPDADGVEVTFLGKEATVEGVHARSYIARRSAKWKRHWRIIDNLQQDEAVAYLQGEGRLALMPSVVDNSPNTVMECIGLGVPFLAARTGGIPELIHPRDVAASTFYHAEVAERGVPFAQALLRTCREGQRPARAAVDAATNETAWTRWHRQMATASDQFRTENAIPPVLGGVSLIVALREDDDPKAVAATFEALAVQSLAPAEILVAGVPLPEGGPVLSGLRHLGDLPRPHEASLWNLAAREATQPHLVFVAVGAELKPDALEVLARSAEQGRLGALTAYRDALVAPSLDGTRSAPVDLQNPTAMGGTSSLLAEGEDEDAPAPALGTAQEGLLAEYPIGGHPASNLLKDSVGEQVVLVAKEAFLGSEGFIPRPDRHVDLATFLVSLSIAGIDTAAVPVPLWTGTPRPAPAPGSSAAYSMSRSLISRCDPLVEKSLRHLPSYARAQGDRAHTMIDHMDWLRRELTAHQEVMDEREANRIKEKSIMKAQLRDLKDEKKSLQKKNKELSVKIERPGFGGRLKNSFRKRFGGKS